MSQVFDFLYQWRVQGAATHSKIAIPRHLNESLINDPTPVISAPTDIRRHKLPIREDACIAAGRVKPIPCVPA